MPVAEVTFEVVEVVADVEMAAVVVAGAALEVVEVVRVVVVLLVVVVGKYEAKREVGRRGLAVCKLRSVAGLVGVLTSNPRVDWFMREVGIKLINGGWGVELVMLIEVGIESISCGWDVELVILIEEEVGGGGG